MESDPNTNSNTIIKGGQSSGKMDHIFLSQETLYSISPLFLFTNRTHLNVGAIPVMIFTSFASFSLSNLEAFQLASDARFDLLTIGALFNILRTVHIYIVPSI
jgi:hypothetical protein